MYYVQKDLNDPSKIKVEKRKADANTICPAPKDDEGNCITDADILDIIDAEETYQSPVYEKDQNGELIVDENDEYIPVLDGNGDQVYEEKVLRTYKKAVVSQAKLDAKNNEALLKQAELDATEYQRLRKAAYPSIGDQMDALYKKLHLGDSTEYDAIAAEIASIKTTYPKSGQ